ncbi:MAG: LysM peptidoglycan-binding domain-containing protein [Chthoniobacteraceae bacterium]
MSRITAAIVGAIFFSPFAVLSEDAQALQEIRELKQLIEQQMKRIDELTVEIGRLHQAVEAQKAALTPGPAPKREVGSPAPFSGYTDTLKPTVARAERVKPEPVVAKEEPKVEAPAGVKHLVEKGETLTAIAKRYNVTLPDLLKANKGVNDRKMQIGQTLTIPIIAAPEGAKPSEPAKTPETPASEKKENP